LDSAPLGTDAFVQDFGVFPTWSWSRTMMMSLWPRARIRERAMWTWSVCESAVLHDDAPCSRGQCACRARHIRGPRRKMKQSLASRCRRAWRRRLSGTRNISAITRQQQPHLDTRKALVYPCLQMDSLKCLGRGQVFGRDRCFDSWRRCLDETDAKSCKQGPAPAVSEREAYMKEVVDADGCDYMS